MSRNKRGEGVGTSKLIYRDGLKVHQYCVALAWAECFRDQRPQSVFVSIESATRSTYLNYTFVSFRVRKQSSNATNIGHSSLDLGISLSPFVYELFFNEEKQSLCNKLCGTPNCDWKMYATFVTHRLRLC